MCCLFRTCVVFPVHKCGARTTQVCRMHHTSVLEVIDKQPINTYNKDDLHA